MARSRITQQGIQITNDNGAILQSLVVGEQLRTSVELKFFTTLRGASIAARLIEADNSSLSYSGGVPDEYPNAVKAGATVKYLPWLYQTSSDSDSETLVDTDELTVVSLDSDYVTNQFQIIWDQDIAEGFDPQPRPDRPVYAFFALEVRDGGTGDKQQIYKPLRGLIELRYSVDTSPFDAI